MTTINIIKNNRIKWIQAELTSCQKKKSQTWLACGAQTKMRGSFKGSKSTLRPSASRKKMSSTKTMADFTPAWVIPMAEERRKGKRKKERCSNFFLFFFFFFFLPFFHLVLSCFLSFLLSCEWIHRSLKECCVCHESLSDAVRTLPCLHSACLTCLDKLIANSTCPCQLIYTLIAIQNWIIDIDCQY